MHTLPSLKAHRNKAADHDYPQVLYDAADVWRLTMLFLVFVFLMATQVRVRT